MDEEVLFRSITGRATQAEEAAVGAWRAASPRNDALFQQLARVLALTADADADRLSEGVPSAEQIVERARVRVASALPAGRRGPEGRTRPAWWWPAAGAAAVVLAVLGTVWWRSWALRTAPELRIHEIVTDQQESATVALGDGSVVRLGPSSRLRIQSARGGEVFLDGHAYFAVAKQKDRPLRIGTPAGEVKVVGTRFDLEATNARLRLMVVEGRVVLVAGGPETAVNAGEQARIVEGIRLPVVAVRSEDIRLDWLGNFLAFQHTPLEDAVREIERQFKVHVQITDSSLASQTITGWFSGWPLEEVVDVVCAVTNAQCTTKPGLVIMQARRVEDGRRAPHDPEGR